MDIVEQAIILRRVKRMIDEHAAKIPVAQKDRLGAVIIGDGLNVTDKGKVSVHCANDAEQDNTLPITSAAVYTEIGNINVLLASI